MVYEIITNRGTTEIDFDKVMELCVEESCEPEHAIDYLFWKKAGYYLAGNGIALIAAEYRKYENALFEEAGLC